MSNLHQLVVQEDHERRNFICTYPPPKLVQEWTKLLLWHTVHAERAIRFERFYLQELLERQETARRFELWRECAVQVVVFFAKFRADSRHAWRQVNEFVDQRDKLLEVEANARLELEDKLRADHLSVLSEAVFYVLHFPTDDAREAEATMRRELMTEEDRSRNSILDIFRSQHRGACCHDENRRFQQGEFALREQLRNHEALEWNELVANALREWRYLFTTAPAFPEIPSLEKNEWFLRADIHHEFLRQFNILFRAAEANRQSVLRLLHQRRMLLDSFIDGYLAIVAFERLRSSEIFTEMLVDRGMMSQRSLSDIVQEQETLQREGLLAECFSLQETAWLSFEHLRIVFEIEPARRSLLLNSETRHFTALTHQYRLFRCASGQFLLSEFENSERSEIELRESGDRVSLIMLDGHYRELRQLARYQRVMVECSLEEDAHRWVLNCAEHTERLRFTRDSHIHRSFSRRKMVERDEVNERIHCYATMLINVEIWNRLCLSASESDQFLQLCEELCSATEGYSRGMLLDDEGAARSAFLDLLHSPHPYLEALIVAESDSRLSIIFEAETACNAALQLRGLPQRYDLRALLDSLCRTGKVVTPLDYYHRLLLYVEFESEVMDRQTIGKEQLAAEEGHFIQVRELNERCRIMRSFEIQQTILERCASGAKKHVEEFVPFVERDGLVTLFTARGEEYSHLEERFQDIVALAQHEILSDYFCRVAEISNERDEWFRKARETMSMLCSVNRKADDYASVTLNSLRIHMGSAFPADVAEVVVELNNGIVYQTQLRFRNSINEGFVGKYILEAADPISFHTRLDSLCARCYVNCFNSVLCQGESTNGTFVPSSSLATIQLRGPNGVHGMATFLLEFDC